MAGLHYFKVSRGTFFKKIDLILIENGEHERIYQFSVFQLTFYVRSNVVVRGLSCSIGAGIQILVLLAVSYGSAEVTGQVLSVWMRVNDLSIP